MRVTKTITIQDVIVQHCPDRSAHRHCVVGTEYSLLRALVRGTDADSHAVQFFADCIRVSRTTDLESALVHYHYRASTPPIFLMIPDHQTRQPGQVAPPIETIHQPGDRVTIGAIQRRNGALIRVMVDATAQQTRSS